MRAKTKLLAIAAVFAVALAVKLPYAVKPFRMCPDAIAYVNIARNWASDHGFVSTLRLNYFDNDPVVHFALADWPPLYPFFAGMLMKLGLSESGLQTANAFLAAFAAVLVFIIADRIFDHKTAVVSGFTTAIALNLFRTSVFALSDILGLTLALAATISALFASDRPSLWFSTGLLAGLAYLTRFPNIVLMVAFIGFALMSRNRVNLVIACLGGFALTAGPVLMWKWILYGSPFYGVQSIHYATISFKQSSWRWWPNGWTRVEIPVDEAVAAVHRNTVYFAANLFGSVTGLFVLTAAFPATLHSYGRSILGNHRGLAITIAALNFTAYASTWSIPAAQGARFMLLSYCLLLPFCAAGILALAEKSGLGWNAVAVGLCVITGFSYFREYPAASRAQQFVPMNSHAVTWIRQNLPKDTILASNNPWVVSHQTGLPTTALPYNLGWKTMPMFLRKYNVGALVILPSRNNSKTLRTVRDHPDWFHKIRLGSVLVMIVDSDARNRSAQPVGGYYLLRQNEALSKL
ncbi:MAG: glycosyltransferase family 39 protein [Armatimonadetes bacterium]|nr:glycosyltransferase family 39 protein [Armatimonadota bacterium]